MNCRGYPRVLRHPFRDSQERFRNMSEARSKIALITGASSGIGAEFARQLAARHYNLILVGRRADRLSAVAAELQSNYAVTADPLVADLEQDADVRSVEERITGLPALDLLVNNAGFGIDRTFAEADLAGQLAMLQVHVVAPSRLTHAALPGMIARQTGGIINVASLAAFMALPTNVNYCATKAYLVTFSRSLAAEVKKKGIKVQALCPGFTITEFHDRPEQGGAGRAGSPRFLWGSAHSVVADSLRALDRGQVICVPGFINHVIRLLARTGLVDRLVPVFLKA
jgi:short-subunit dehydrogenase